MAFATVLPPQEEKKIQVKKPCVCFRKQTANGILQWSTSKGHKFLPSNQIRRTKFKHAARRVKLSKSKALTIIPGLNLPPLDESYDEDQLQFLWAQRIYHVAIVDDFLEIKYTDGRQKKFRQGTCQHWGRPYDIERIIVMLNSEDRVERIWKLELIDFVKMKRDHQAERKKNSEELLKKREEEMAAMEAKVDELRAMGLCRVKFNPYIIEYKKYGRNVKIRMDYICSYSEKQLNEVLKDLSGSPLIEELTVMEDIILAMEENAKKKAKEAEEKMKNENLQAKAQKMNPKGYG